MRLSEASKTRVCKQCNKRKLISLFWYAGYTRKGIERYDMKCKSCRNLLAKDKCKIKRKLIKLKQIAKHPEKKAAYTIVNSAVASKKLTKGTCEICKAKKVEAHHDDYTKPLKVRWLCRIHHAELHRKYFKKQVLQRLRKTKTPPPKQAESANE